MKFRSDLATHANSLPQLRKLDAWCVAVQSVDLPLGCADVREAKALQYLDHLTVNVGARALCGGLVDVGRGTRGHCTSLFPAGREVFKTKRPAYAAGLLGLSDVRQVLRAGCRASLPLSHRRELRYGRLCALRLSAAATHHPWLDAIEVRRRSRMCTCCGVAFQRNALPRSRCNLGKGGPDER